MKKLFGFLVILFGLVLFTSCTGGNGVQEDVSSQNDNLAKQWLVGNANIADVYTTELVKPSEEESNSRYSIQLPADVNSMIRTHVYSGLDGEELYKVSYTSLRNSSTVLTSSRNVITKAVKDNEEMINAQFSGVFEGSKVQTTWDKEYEKDTTESVYVAYLPLLFRFYNEKEATTPFLLTFVLIPIKVENTTLPTDENPAYSSSFAENTKELIIPWTANKAGDIKLD